MFKVVLKNVGSDMVNKEFVVHCRDINVVSHQAFKACKDILGYGSGVLFKVVGEEILITRDDITVGSLSITKLN